MGRIVGIRKKCINTNTRKKCINTNTRIDGIFRKKLKKIGKMIIIEMR